MEAIRQKGWVLEFASKTLRSDKEAVMESRDWLVRHASDSDSDNDSRRERRSDFDSDSGSDGDSGSEIHF